MIRRCSTHVGIVLLLLVIHIYLVAVECLAWSPTVDEVAHLPAGISHWAYGNFDLYCVNPPLVRLIAALPLLFTSATVDWSGYRDSPGLRPEFSIGDTFLKVNGTKSFWYFSAARLACLPFTAVGAVFCYLWAYRLYGPTAGLIALALWCVCPNVLGYAALITPDLGAAAFGVVSAFGFWQWLRHRTMFSVFVAGIGLGLAELSKSTWIILFGLWPVLAIAWQQADRLPNRAIEDKKVNGFANSATDSRPPLFWFELVCILLVGLFILNLGYGFEKSFQRLSQFQFVSHLLGGNGAHTIPGNRFTDTLVGNFPVPVPANFLHGIDIQRSDFERGKWSYLFGEMRFGGWWYYYVFAMAVKIPVGTMLLCGLASLSGILRAYRGGLRCMRDDMIVLLPGVALIIFVSGQTGFSRYLRYVLPAFPFMFVWISQVGRWFDPIPTVDLFSSKTFTSVGFDVRQRCLRILPAVIVTVSLSASVISSLSVWPHSLSYFNELVGGPRNGSAYLLDANIDWGQDLLYFKKWHDSHPEARPISYSYFGFADPRLAGVDLPPVPSQPTEMEEDTLFLDALGPTPGWHAISVNHLNGYKHLGPETDRYAYLRRFTPVARVGYSTQIFYLTFDEANQLRREMGLPPVSSDVQSEQPVSRLAN